MSEDLNLAKDINTSSTQLQELLSKNPRNDEVLNAIAVHPNMTKELLIELAHNDNPLDNEETDYFYKTDQNPGMDSLLSEHPNLVEDIYVECFDGLPELYPADDMDICLSYGEEYSSFFYCLPNWFIEIAAKHKNEDLRSFIAVRMEGVPKQLEEQLARDESADVRYAMALSPSVSSSVLSKLAKDEDDEVRAAVARNEHTPTSVLEQLAEDEDVEVRKALAKNARCRDLDYYKRLRFAIHESQIKELKEVKNAFASLIKKLAQDKDAYVRTTIAENEDTPASILKKFLEDEDSDVRQTAARNKNISA